MYVNVSSYWRPGFFFLFFSYAEVVFKKLFIEFNGTSECLKWFLKHYSVCSVTNFSFLVFFGSFFSPLLSILYFFCLFVSSLRLILWTLKLLYKRCWQEKINVKDVIKGLGNDIMQGNVCCVKHGIAVCKSEYDSLLWNWEHIKLLKLPATLLCVFKMLSKVALAYNLKKNCHLIFPGFLHIEILEAFSL